MTDQEKYVKKCTVVLGETLSSLMEDASADDRYAMLMATRGLIQEYLDELAED